MYEKIQKSLEQIADMISKARETNPELQHDVLVSRVNQAIMVSAHLEEQAAISKPAEESKEVKPVEEVEEAKEDPFAKEEAKEDSVPESKEEVEKVAPKDGEKGDASPI